ncbi:MAG: leucine-rich repeat protein [Firmicutes bacterium]|nr:leucine-rich repeat protein [Bacillota bacterium]
MKRKSLLCVLLIAVVVFAGLAAVACRPPAVIVPPGPESGTYYCVNNDESEYRLTLHSGNQFAISVKDTIRFGEYTLEGSQLKLVFVKAEDADVADVTATLQGLVITMDYAGETITFLKQVVFTVDFNADQGVPVPASIPVMNGRTIQASQKPVDPVRAGYYFVGWYKESSFATAFRFGDDVVTGNMTLYAYFAPMGIGRQFAVGFDWNFNGAPANPAETETIGGKLYTQPAQITRNGYTFRGWWVSMHDRGDRLAYPLVLASTVFEENTTLFALWQENVTGGLTPAEPVVEVSAGLIKWTLDAVATSCTLKIVDPNGITAIDTTVSVQSSSYPFTFSQAGNYVVTMTAIGASSAYVSQPAVRHYINRALARVSIFDITDAKTLKFEPVKNATQYLLTVDCGNKLHNHTDVNLGNSTVYDFSTCEMQRGGIKFTVKALGSGWVTSESRTVPYDKTLAKVTAVEIDTVTQTAIWTPVPNATNYIVSVKAGTAEYQTDNGGKTVYSLKGYNAGALQISVRPETVGYNSPEGAAIWFAYNKTSLAAPGDVRLEGNVIKWSPVTNATGYNVRIGGLEIDVTPDGELEGDIEYELTADDLAALKALGASSFELSVRADGASPSLYSDSVVVGNAMSAEISYYQGAVYWQYVLGAARYEIKVNTGTAAARTYVVYDANNVRIELTQPQTNTITFMAFSADGEPLSWDEAIIQVYAYTVSFEARGGLLQTTKLYKAFGDPVDDFPVATRTGYDQNNWYTSPGGAAQNAGKYTNNTFTGGDIVLYADWKAHRYTLTLDYGEGVVVNAEPEVTYDGYYALEVPAVEGNGFVGWYTQPDGQGDKFTNERGVGYTPWTVADADDMVLYAFYAQLLSFVAQGSSYTVTRGPDIGLVTSVVIPDTYNGLPVTVIGILSYALLESVTVGKNIEIIEDNAFNGCRSLVNIYANPGSTLYSDRNGILYNKVGTELALYPTGRTTLTIPVGTTSIGDKAFKNCLGLTEITIPGYVETIGQDAFYNCNNLTGVTLLKGIKTIGDYAFSGCYKLTEITFPADMTYIGINPFENCTGLRKITFAGGSTVGLDIGESAFVGAYRLNEVIFEEGSMVETIGANAFFSNAGLIEINIPASVKKIGNYAFQGASRLETVTVADGSQLSEIGTLVFKDAISLKTVIFEGTTEFTRLYDDIFSNLKALESVTLPVGLTSVDAKAFEGCAALRTLTFAAGSVVTIGAGALNGCVSLIQITLPGLATNLNGSLFADCVNMETILVTEETNPNYVAQLDVLYTADMTRLVYHAAMRGIAYQLPASVTSIDAGALDICPRIGAFTVATGNPVFTALNGALLANNGATLLRYAPARTNTSYEVPNTVQTIATYAFKDCKNLTTITYQAVSVLETIATYAFDGCSNLQTMTLPGTVTSIGAYAFSGCTRLTTMALAEGAVSIQPYAFAGMTGLTSMTIPSTVTLIGEGAFKGCTALTTVNFAAGSELEVIGDYAFQGCTALTATGAAGVILPVGLTTIGNYAFQGCTNANFRVVEIPNTVTTLGSFAYQGNNQITTITFKGGAGSAELVMGTNVFQGCIRLATLTFEADSKVQNIGDYAFQGCLNGSTAASVTFKSVIIPASVKAVGDYAFQGCTIVVSLGAPTWTYAVYGLENVTFEEGIQLKTVGDYAFQGIANTTLVLPEGLEEIGDSAFRAPSASGFVLTDLTLPSSLKIIGDHGFRDQRALTALTLPDSLEVIGQYAFYSCFKIANSLVIPANVVSVGDSAFQDAFGSQNTNSGMTLSFAAASKLETIGVTAFGGSSKLVGTDLILPTNVKSIGDTAFSSFAFTGKLGIPASVTSMGQGIISSSYFSSVELPEGITAIGDQVFRGHRFDSVTIPASVTTIGYRALEPLTSPPPAALFTTLTFAPGSQLTSVELGAKNANGVYDYAPFHYYGAGPKAIENLPASILPQDIYSFFGNATTQYTITDPASPYTALNDALYDKAGTTLLFYPLGKTGAFTTPTAVTAIGDYAFAGLNASYRPKVTSITLSDNVVTIGAYAFQNSSVTAFTAALATSKLTGIGEGAFYGCNSLATISIPDGLKVIGPGAFGGCLAIATVLMNEPHSVFEKDGSFLMYITTGSIACVISSTPTITIPGSVTSIPAYAFAGRTNITTVNIHAGVTSIGAYAFNGCTALATVNYTGTSQLQTIDERAFFGCSNYRAVTIPASVTSIGDFAFNNGTGVSSIDFGSGNVPLTIGNNAFAGGWNTLGTTLNVTERVVSIGSNAFNGTFRGTTLNLPASLVNLSESAFAASTVVTITFANNSRMRTLGIRAFSGCTSLTSVNFGQNSSLTRIGQFAFQGCTNANFNSITLPDEIEGFDMEAFGQCNNLRQFVVSENNLNFTAIDGVLFNKAGNTLALYPFGKNMAIYTVPEMVTTIGTYAFSMGTAAPTKTVRLHNGVTTIESGAFRYGITINIPLSVTKIGVNAFSNGNNTTIVNVQGRTPYDIPGGWAEGWCEPGATINWNQPVTNY